MPDNEWRQYIDTLWDEAMERACSMGCLIEARDFIHKLNNGGLRIGPTTPVRAVLLLERAVAQLEETRAELIFLRAEKEVLLEMISKWSQQMECPQHHGPKRGCFFCRDIVEEEDNLRALIHERGTE